MTIKILTHQDLLAHYLAHLRAKGKKKLTPYSTWAARFVEYAGSGPLTKELVQRFLEERTNGMKSGSRRFVFGVIRTLFNVNELPWPFRTGEGPQIAHDVKAPELDFRIIEAIIKAAREGRLNSEEACVVALLTTYGLSTAEISELTKESLQADFLEFSPTGGFPRLFLIPEEIRPYLEGWGFDTRLTENKVRAIWRSIEEKSGIQHYHGTSYHFIRRNLMKIFLRRLRATQGKGIDEVILRFHPLLPMWKEAVSGKNN